MADWIAAVNWSVPTWDLFIALFFVVAGFFYSFSLGRDRLIVVLVSTYMALAVANSTPVVAALNPVFSRFTPYDAFQLSAFLGVFILLFVALSSSALLNTLTAGVQGSWWQVLIFGMLQAGLLISVVLSFVPEPALANLSNETRLLFTSPEARFAWVTLPILALILFERGTKS